MWSTRLSSTFATAISLAVDAGPEGHRGSKTGQPFPNYRVVLHANTTKDHIEILSRAIKRKDEFARLSFSDIVELATRMGPGEIDVY
jgi:hypothetical protein